VSPVEQDTIDCEYLAYFEAKKSKNYKRDFMQLLVQTLKYLLKEINLFLARENMKNAFKSCS
jgi:hypothetical protein